VALEGTIREVLPLGGGIKFHLADDSGEIVALVWEDTYQDLVDPEALTAGARVRVVGEISTYEGRLEIIPERAVDVTLLAPAGDDRSNGGTAPLPLGNLTAEDVGETIRIEGSVVEISSFSQGFKLTLDDGSGRCVLLLWHTVFDELEDTSGLDLGARVAARGAVEAYQGQLQIVPQAGADVSVVTPGTSNAVAREIGMLTLADVGQLVTARGSVTRSEPFSSGRRIWVEDGSGTMMVLLWDAIDQHLAPPPSAGDTIRVTGVVEEYQGTLEIVPRLPGDVGR
jgi:DNA/RNA endonuclease YhcR with UshA esterase domain